MANDTCDWVRDLRHGNVTYLLSEGHRQKRDGESVSGWMVRRGFEWSVGWLDDRMGDLRPRAEALGSPQLVRFLDYQRADIRELALDLRPRLQQLAALADVFEPAVRTT